MGASTSGDIRFEHLIFFTFYDDSSDKASIHAQMGNPPVRRENLFVGYLSKIRNAKLMQRMIRVTYQGYDLGDTTSLVNPQAAEEIRQAR